MSGLPGRRWASACALQRVGQLLAILLVSLGLSAVVPVQAADVAGTTTGAFLGTIKDSVGHVLGGVEVLIVRRSAGPAAVSSAVAPVATASSDLWGRFTISDLPPGVYGIAAIKEGYRTYVGRVDTRINQAVDVVLFPMPTRSSLAPGTIPKDGDWLLRLPRRTVFRDTGATVLDDQVDDESPSRTIPSPDVPIQLRVDQLFAVRAPLADDSEDPVKLQGDETRVRLAAPIGERGTLRLDGSRASLGSSQENADGASASSESVGLNVDFAYDTSLDSRISVKAFFSERELEWGAADAVSAATRRQSWGYESEWQKQLDDESSFRVGLEYDSQALSLPALQAGSAAAGFPSATLIGKTLSRRTASANAAYETQAAGRHHLQVAFKAQLFDSPETQSIGMPLEGGRGNLTGGEDGWSLQFSAKDSWSLSGPFTLLYGMDYQQALTRQDAAVLVPQLGGAWAVDRVAMRVVMSYHSVGQWNQAPLGSKYDRLQTSMMAEASAQRSRSSLPSNRNYGYAAEVEVPLTESLSLKGYSSFVPLQLEGLGSGRSTAGVAEYNDSETYLTNGATAVGESSLSLTHELGDSRIWFEISRGQAQGMLARGATDSTLPTLALGELTYDNGAWGFQMIPTGTDLRVLYKRVVESQADDNGGHPTNERETFELRLIQNLMRFEGLGNWRLLMAVRMATQDSESDDLWARGTDPAVLRAFNEGVSAGLSVTF